MRNPRASVPHVRAKTLATLLVALGLAIAPHTPRLPGWEVPVLLALAGWRLDLDLRRRPLPSRWLLLALTILGGFAVWATYRGVVGRDGFLALFTLLLGLKLLEMRTVRDRMLVVFLAYFLVMTDFLYSQSMPTAAYVFTVLLVITVALVDLNDVLGTRTHWQNLCSALRMLGQALPLVLVVFVLFPRVSGQLWGLPRDAFSGQTGLSDTMAPGTIAQVALSDAVAFRAEFVGTAPEPRQLYWRGPVFEYTDGTRWTAGPKGPVPGTRTGRERLDGVGPRRLSERSLVAGNTFEYTVTLEPHNEHWLFALDLPALAPDGATVTPEFLVWSYAPVRERSRYRMVSSTAHATGNLNRQARLRALDLPRVSPRVRSLATRWRAEAAQDADIVDRALRFFRNGSFVYTLSPPLLGRDPVDEFLFETRRGFCEHYAAGFTVLMRAAGLPARVVTGYQGGEYNPVGDYFIVRQAQAHAWSEVWVSGRGWFRVDPTAAVAPERVEWLVDRASLAEGDAVRFVLRPTSRLARGIRRIQHLLDSVNHGWNQWVLGYGRERQIDLLARLGFPRVSSHHAAAALALAASLVLLGIAGQMVHEQSARKDPLLRFYDRYCRKLARRGLGRRPHEGPRAFAERICAVRADLASEVQTITELYVRLRYDCRDRHAPDPGNPLRTLKHRVRRFRP